MWVWFLLILSIADAETIFNMYTGSSTSLFECDTYRSLYITDCSTCNLSPFCENIAESYLNSCDQCVECPAGTYQPHAFTCWDCKVNAYSVEKNARACQECPSGMRTTSNGQSCEACPNGVCNPCTAGTYWSGRGDECLPCSADSISANNATSCTQCAEGLVGISGNTVCGCPPGTENNNGVCEWCTHGTFENNGVCEPCPNNKATAYGSTSCASSSFTQANCYGNEIYTGVANKCRFPCGASKESTGCIPVDSTSCNGLFCRDCETGKYSTASDEVCSTCDGVTHFTRVNWQWNANTGSVEQVKEIYGGDRCLCGSGTYSPTGSPPCSTCPLGYTSEISQADFDSNTGATQCTQCTQEFSNGTHCWGSCPAGEIWLIDNNPHSPGYGHNGCQSCYDKYIPETGQYVPTVSPGEDGSGRAFVVVTDEEKGNGCMACPSGTAPNGDSTACESLTPCSPGNYTLFDNGPGTEICGVCEPGKYSDEYAQTTCKVCPDGYESNFGDTSCTACAAGTFTEYTGAICTKCPSGKMRYYNPKGVGCVNCDLLGMQPKSDATGCENCPAGTYNDEYGTMCKSCPAGLYSQTMATQCETCSDGDYSWDSITCASCPSGYQTGTTANTCDICPAGQFRNYGTQDTCTSCAIGTFSNEGASSCTSCHTVGGYQDEAGKGSCKSCPVGHRATESNGCFACSAGEYANGAVCSSCPSGYNSEAASDECFSCNDDGYDANCNKCPAGKSTSNLEGLLSTVDFTRRTENSSTTCLDCPIGKYSSGGTSCILCDAGKYTTEVGRGYCDTCPTYSSADRSVPQISNEGRYECSPCFINTEEDGPHNYVGRYPDGGVCRECPKGKFQYFDVYASCQECPHGRTTPGTGTYNLNGNQFTWLTDPSFHKHSDEIQARLYGGTYDGITYDGDIENICSVACVNSGYGTIESLYGKYEHRDEALDCVLCPAGTFESNHLCVTCPEGHISSPGSQSCEACPSGKAPSYRKDECLTTTCLPPIDDLCNLSAECTGADSLTISSCDICGSTNFTRTGSGTDVRCTELPTCQAGETINRLTRTCI